MHEGVRTATFADRFRLYRIKPAAAARDAAQLRLRWGEDGARRFLLIPHVEGVELALAPRLADAPLALASDDAVFEDVGPFSSLWLRLRALWTKRKYIVDCGDFRILIGGRQSARRTLVAAVKYLRRLGTPLEGETIRRRPELVLGWGPGGVALPAPPAPRRASAAKVAIVLHLYYADLWPELRAVLESLPVAFDLIVTTVPDRDELAADIRAAFPAATIRVLENRGRDVRPFLVLLEEGSLDAYDCVCKIHGKKTLRGAARNPYGEIGRRRLLFELLCAEGAMARAVERFERNPALGLLGPAVFRVAGPKIAKFFWKDNREAMVRLMSRLGRTPADIEPDFFAGTMFWVRPRALALLRAARLSHAFEADQGRTDGTLEHALERTVSSLVKMAGYEVEESDALAAQRAPGL